MSLNLTERAQYIIKFQALCDQYLPAICDPKDKSVLVIGCGWGTEMLWSLMKGAREVTGIDVKERDTEALDEALQYFNCYKPGNYKMVQMDVANIAELNQKFDLVLSLNVFEHLPDIDLALKLCRNILSNEGRIAIFADPLYYSSCGSHIPEDKILPWEHIWNINNEIVAKRNMSGLNKATLSDFINAIHANDLIILHFSIVPDRNLAKPEYLLKAIMSGSKSVTDLTTEGVCMELAYVKKN